MDAVLLIGILDIVVFLLPIAALFIKAGKYLKRIEGTEESLQEMKGLIIKNIEEIKVIYDADIKEIKENHETAIEEVKENFTKEIKEIKENHEKDVEQLKQENNSTVSMLTAMSVSIGKIERTVELLLNGQLSIRAGEGKC